MKNADIELYQVIGAIDSRGHCQHFSIFREKNGDLSQGYPGHFYHRLDLMHKKWRWWVKENRLDGPELMHWEPDVEEMDQIHRAVERAKSWMPDIPRYGLNGSYPSWPKIYEPKR